MRFDPNAIWAQRSQANEDAPRWLMADSAISLAIRDVNVDFLHATESDDMETTEQLVARLEAVLVDGYEIDLIGDDFWEVCDGYAWDLGVMAEIAKREGVLENELGGSRHVLLIRQLDLGPEILDAENFAEFFDLIPRAIFLLYNAKPDLYCYVVAEQEGYYDELAADALLDPRSVDGYSPLIYADSGFTLDPTGALFYRLVMRWR